MQELAGCIYYTIVMINSVFLSLAVITTILTEDLPESLVILASDRSLLICE